MKNSKIVTYNNNVFYNEIFKILTDVMCRYVCVCVNITISSYLIFIFKLFHKLTEYGFIWIRRKFIISQIFLWCAAIVLFFIFIHFDSIKYVPYANHVYRQFYEMTREARWLIELSWFWSALHACNYITCILISQETKHALPFALLVILDNQSMHR